MSSLIRSIVFLPLRTRYPTSFELTLVRNYCFQTGGSFSALGDLEQRERRSDRASIHLNSHHIAAMDSVLTTLPSEGAPELLMPLPEPKRKRKMAAEYFGPSTRRSLRSSSSKIDVATHGPSSVEYAPPRAYESRAGSPTEDDEDPHASKKQRKIVISKNSDKRLQVQKKRKKSIIAKTGTGDILSNDGDGPAPKEAQKPHASKTTPVYIIPDVERRETTFKGRLGTYFNLLALLSPISLIGA